MVKIHGNSIEFQSNSEDPYIELFPQPDKTLRISGPEITNAVLVNPNLSGIDELEINKLYSKISTDELGRNQLSSPELMVQADITNFRSQGISVSISENASTTTAVAGAPYQVPASYEGGVVLYESISNGAFTLEGAYEYTTFTSDALAGEFSDINEAGDCVAFSNGALEGNTTFQFLRKSGGTWSINGAEDLILFEGHTIKISGDYVVCTYKQLYIEVYKLNGGVWEFQQELEPSGAAFIAVKTEIINQNKIFYFEGSNIKVWDRVGTVWTNNLTIPSPGLTSLSAYGSLMTYTDSSNLYIYTDGSLTKVIPKTGLIASCCRDYVFYATSSNIYVATLIGGVWTESLNSTALSGISSMACNSNRLVVGRPTINTYGRTSIFTISYYENEILENNTIVLEPTDLEITSAFKNVELTSDLINLNGNTNVVHSGILSAQFQSTGTILRNMFCSNSYIFAKIQGLQSIPSNITTTITNVYGATTISGNDILDPTISSGTITLGTAGFYLISYSVAMDPSSTGYREFGVLINDVAADNFAVVRVSKPSTTVGERVSGSGFRYIDSGTTIKLYAFQNSGSNLTFLNQGYISCLRVA